MRDDARQWPPREEALFLRFQPVFTAQGQVHEYAVADSLTPWTGDTSDLLRQRARLRAAAAFAGKFAAPLDMSFAHPLHAPDDADLAQRLCRELDIGLSQDRLWFGAAQGDVLQGEGDASPLLPSLRLTFCVPLTGRLLTRAHLLERYADFQVALRARLLPAIQGGRPAAHGVLRAVGLTLQIPRGLAGNRILQSRFFALIECAAAANLRVVADGIDDIQDFAWMRLHHELLFRGQALSAPLSAQCLDVWLQADGQAWRSFNACTARWTGAAGG